MTAIPHWRVTGAHDEEHRQGARDWSSTWNDGEGLHISAAVAADRPQFRLRFERGATFDVLPAERLIVASANEDNIPQLTVDLLLTDQVEPRVLAYEGNLIIHASAVELDGQAILFVGDSGVGKSTLAASFDNSGTPILCDDALIVTSADGEATARALYPTLRLHPDSFEALYPELSLSATDSHHGLKRRLRFSGQRAKTDVPLPIAAIFALGHPQPTESVQIEAMSSAELCIALVTNSFSLNPADLRLAAEKLQKSGLVAERVTAFSLDYPRAYDSLPMVRDAIVQKVRSLAGRE